MRVIAFVAIALVASGPFAAAAEDHAAPAPAAASHPAKGPTGELIQAEPPPFTEGIYPCSSCHDKPGDATRRTLGFHDEIQQVLSHGENRWCLDCHDNAKRDVLHLVSGETVPFTESYRICGQCHGDKYRDWRAGVHGKRVGHWNGAKTYFLCVNCHNPHSPKFRGVQEIAVDGKATVAPTLTALKPLPPPVRPENMRK